MAEIKEIVIRPVTDTDSEGLISLIGTVFDEYQNCFLDVDGEMPELKAPARSVMNDDCRWWVAEEDGAVVGSCAAMPDGSDAVELKRLYVAKQARRRGLAARLVELVETEARTRGARRIELWSDTRFKDAHRLYKRMGYERQPRTRALCDISNTVEFHYIKELAP